MTICNLRVFHDSHVQNQSVASLTSSHQTLTAQIANETHRLSTPKLHLIIHHRDRVYLHLT
ncbi:uncharacterized protein BDZ83DRAFT_625712, partial [Colletotrichum acutatum]